MDFIPVTRWELEKMLAALGIEDVAELFARAIPDNVRLKRPLDIPSGISEFELTGEMRAKAGANASPEEYPSFLGGGAYDHFIPAVVGTVASLPELYTAYTPYQPEVSQGVLQSLFEYQSMICELTGFEVANASLYDGSTAVAEAALLAHDVTGGKRVVLVSEALHPEYRDVLRNYTRGLDITIRTIPMAGGRTDIEALEGMLDDEIACVIIQQPNFFGYIEDTLSVGALLNGRKALFVACVDPISLGILAAPAEYGADVAVGEGQALGNAAQFGGPYLGIFACRYDFVRRVPGHLISATVDAAGREGYVLTLQAREQHIRRERATSNICTSEALNAIIAGAYMSYMGPDGLREAASQCLHKAHYAHECFSSLTGVRPFSDAPFFKEFALSCDVPVAEINARLFAEGIIGGLDVGRLYPEFENVMLVSVTEKRTKEEIDKMAAVLESM